ncbi:MAG: aromatic aminobenezylarsenical efflux permease ArsG family transporter [Bacteroidia bacterium]|nr:aromatic aminobenezylarsenical efflux permease ArsG family transporter [Bacteroidia bacterium]
MSWLQGLLENSQWPILTAFLLGLMTAISPCPLATNISAIAFIGKNITDKKTVLLKGVIYTLGRAFTYTLIGLLFFFGLGEVGLSGFFQRWGEKILGPLLIIIGLFMLGVIKLKIPGLGKLTERMENQAGKGYWGVFLLGVVFALGFCPYSGVLYFVMLIPMTIASAHGLYLPFVFAIATGLPVILFAWMIAYAVGSVGSIYDKIKVFELWFRRVVAVLFIGVGIYYIIVTMIV